jgi:adenylate cyclase
MRLSPLDPMRFNTLFGVGHAFFVKAHYDEAAEWLEKGIREKPTAFWAYRMLTASYALGNRLPEARRALAIFVEAYPGLTVSRAVAASAGDPNFRERVAEGLRKAGLPE